MNLNTIISAVKHNNLISHSNRLRTHLNDTARDMQTTNLEEKVVRFNERFAKASDAGRGLILKEMDRVMKVLDQEEHNTLTIQDPPSMQGRRTFGKGGKRLQTGAEIAEKELQREQQTTTLSRPAKATLRPNITRSSNQPTNQPTIPIIDLTSPLPTRTTRIPFVMTFSASGAVVRGPEMNKSTATAHHALVTSSDKQTSADIAAEPPNFEQRDIRKRSFNQDELVQPRKKFARRK